MTRHFVLTHRVKCSQAAATLVTQTRLEGGALSQYDVETPLDGSRAVSVRDGGGEGWSFIIPERAGVQFNRHF